MVGNPPFKSRKDVQKKNYYDCTGDRSLVPPTSGSRHLNHEECTDQAEECRETPISM